MTISSPIDALQNYIGTGFFKINDGLRRGKPNKTAQLLDRLMRTGEEDTVLYRATDMNEIGTGKFPVTGEIVHQKAYLSTSTDSQMDFYRARFSRVWIELRVPARVRRIVVRDVCYDRFDHPEQEVILQRGLRWRIDSSVHKNDRFFVKGTVL